MDSNVIMLIFLGIAGVGLDIALRKFLKLFNADSYIVSYDEFHKIAVTHTVSILLLIKMFTYVNTVLRTFCYNKK